MSNAKPRCSKRLFKDYTSYNCQRAGVIEYEGKFYCKQHDPVAVKARDEERRAKWDAQWAEEKRLRELNALRDKACDGCTATDYRAAIKAGGLKALLARTQPEPQQRDADGTAGREC